MNLLTGHLTKTYKFNDVTNVLTFAACWAWTSTKVKIIRTESFLQIRPLEAGAATLRGYILQTKPIEMEIPIKT